MLVNEDFALFRSKSSVTEHTDLSHNVIPVSRHLQSIEFTLKCTSHVNDALRNHLEFFKPFVVQCGGSKNLCCDSCTMSRRVRVHGTDHQLDLREGSGGSIFACSH